ncbi:hypothetical protein OV203_13250 [Nannocystis sp. ILAH1]|uniref:hypothetical protein n=1 Tax=unclassified Nannocystis TaxID=2627009 RepID=UPI00226D49EA|nr:MULTISPECIES: hypothetical protein [unclassified Nannocystis]MCY0988098.1 hypothetical protein [Nannocystis sp. ILAH1]MCY1065520.1 hypothetical protein [Nannocystis sp. RBIL2]
MKPSEPPESQPAEPTSRDDSPASARASATPLFARYLQRCLPLKTGVKAGEGRGGKWPFGA